MIAQDIAAQVKLHVDHLVSEGYSAMHTDEHIEKDIIETWIRCDSSIPEEIKLTFLGLLVVFELRRREMNPACITH